MGSAGRAAKESVPYNVWNNEDEYELTLIYIDWGISYLNVADSTENKLRLFIQAIRIRLLLDLNLTRIERESILCLRGIEKQQTRDLFQLMFWIIN